MHWKVKTESHFDDVQKRIVTLFNLENIPDIRDVFFDHAVPLSRVNKDGAYVGYHKTITENEHPVEIFEFWRKHYKTVKYGVRRSINSPDELVYEVARNGVSYIKKYKLQEVDFVSHQVWKKNELVYSEKWPYKTLPFVIGLGVHIDNFSDIGSTNYTYDGKRVSLAPFAEHVRKPQMVLDYAASLQLHNIKMSRGTTKFMFAEGMLSKEQADVWKARNTTDNDLPYSPPVDVSGNPIPGWRPEPVPDVPLSPTVTEALSGLPTMINALLGVNLEQDITYNASGEAIRQMQVVRHKNAKLYTDHFLNLLDDLGKVVKSYIPIIFAGPHYITIDNNGRPQNIFVNSEDVYQHPPIMISDLMESHDLVIGAGKNRVSEDEQTRLALEQLYRISASVPALSAQVVSSTLDIYADSLDSPASADISQRISLLISPEIKALSEGSLTVEDIEQQRAREQMEIQQQQQVQQINQNELMAQKMNVEDLEAKARMVKAQADVENANARVVESNEKLKATQLKTNAEIAKSFGPERR